MTPTSATAAAGVGAEPGLDEAWLAEAARCVRERLPRTLAIMLTILAIAWLVEHRAHPDRDLAYALALGAEALACAATIRYVRARPDHPRRALRATAAATLFVAACVTVYHLSVRGELEMLATAYSCLLFGAAAVLPWGARRQAMLGTALVAALCAAALAVPAIVSTPVALVASAAVAAVTTYGAALAERQLRGLLARDLAIGRTNAELERANRLKSEFVSAVSHELRTPLNVMVGYVDMLLDGAFGPLALAQRDPLVRIRHSAEELHALVTATLDLGRLEQGRVELLIAPIAPADQLARLRRETRELQEHSGLAFRWHCDDGLPLLDTDTAKLDVVLKNLVANAVKFTDHGSVTVSATARDGGVEISVRDTGIGIPPDTQRAIFEAFRQGAAAAARSAGGVGLGLHISRRLLELLGGTITLESELGRGSVFRVWLPRTAPGAGSQRVAAVETAPVPQAKRA